MKQSIQKSKIFLFTTVFFLIIGGIALTFYINLEKQSTIITEAIVTYVGNKYIVVEDDKEEEYVLDTTEEYNIGDKISFKMKNIEKDSYPKKGTVEKIDIVSRTETFESTVIEESLKEETDNINNNITDKITNNSTNNNESNNQNTINNNNDNNITNEPFNETAVVTYFENLNYNLENYSQDKSLGESIKSGFVSIVDFLFYDGEIKGITFDELSTTTKLKVLELALSIDQKIDKHFPGYKETISTTSSNIYTNVKAKVIESYLDITTKVCINHSETCNAAKDGLSDLKSSFSLTWSFIKEISGVGLSKLKAWYEVWKSC